MNAAREPIAAVAVEGLKSRNLALRLRACEIDARLDCTLMGGIYLWYAPIPETADWAMRQVRRANEPQWRADAPAEAA